MTRAARWTVGIVLGLAVLAVALLWTFQRLVPDDATLATRVATAAEEKIGVKTTVGRAHLALWPVAELTLEDVVTAQEQPIRIRRLVAKLQLSELLRKRAGAIQSVEIDGAVVPMLSLTQLHAKGSKDAPELLAAPLVRFRDLIWVTRYGKQLSFEGSAAFDLDAWPRRVELIRTGVQPVAQLTLTRDGADRWNVQAQVGGGTADGQVSIRRSEDGKLQLAGQVAPQGIEVASMLDAFKVRPPLRGKASGQTQLSGSGATLGALAGSLHTRTTFTVGPATLLNFDVDKAIRSFGKDRAGQTALRSVTGRMDTQNTPEGMVVRITGLQAQGLSFSATGEGTIAKRHVQGKASVNLVGGMVEVPLRIAGPVDQPNVTVPTSAVASAAVGAAVGTAVLPGIGTAIGAKLGQMLGGPK